MTIIPEGGLYTCGRSSKGISPRHSHWPDAPSRGTSPGQPLSRTGNAARGVIADISVDIGVDEVLSRTGEALERGGEFIPVTRAVDIEQGKLHRADPPPRSTAWNSEYFPR